MKKVPKGDVLDAICTCLRGVTGANFMLRDKDFSGSDALKSGRKEVNKTK